MGNLLSKENSLYLLQHAQNPVHWMAWNEESLEKSMTENKLLLISIGYSACHWCHVMEHETFEDKSVADLMNQHFVNIKVDREERPDVDAIYMKAVQMMTGRGGWPMNVVCLPDGRPVWGGTYFKKEVWMNTLKQLAELYAQSPEKMVEYAEKLNEGLQFQAFEHPESESVFDIAKWEILLSHWKQSFDLDMGGYSRAPKFMMPTNLEFLQVYGFINQDESLLEYVDLTLTKMAWGGIFDTIGGGFSRYSVDMKWHIPHFEKMLYDNAQLLSIYSKAYQRTQNPIYKNVIEQTISFVKREFLNDGNGISSALDADSLNQQNQSEEGAFYVWKKEELHSLLGINFELFAQVYNINDFGYWEHENYVLIQTDSFENIALKNNLTEKEVIEIIATSKEILFKNREKRKKPSLDPKCLTSWNALMITGWADAFKALGNLEDKNMALSVAKFIQDELWDENGNLFHTFQNGKASIQGFLEDYAFVIKAWISLYEITLNEFWLFEAKKIMMQTLDKFYDVNRGLFLFSSSDEKPWVAPHFEIEDNVIPASNSVMAHNLFELSIYFENSYFEKIAVQMLHKILPIIDYPSAFSNWMELYFKINSPHTLITISGSKAQEWHSEIISKYLPQVMVVAHIEKTELPILHHLNDVHETRITYCEGKTCSKPLKSLEELWEIMNLKIN
jgi:uncharacterized protein YyaL (SSP411 family)